MNVLLLGPHEPALGRMVLATGDTHRRWEAPLSPEVVRELAADFLISFRYRHIIRPEVLALFPGRAVNLHISYLPWNRGADPNLWSFVENTPKGVTVHHIDEGLDTGDIIAQKRMEFDRGRETLASSYAQLCSAVLELFALHWPVIRDGRGPRAPQPPGGSIHKAADKHALQPVLAELGWNTPVAKLMESV